MADSATPVVVSTADSNVEYGKIITDAGTGILLSGARCHATIGLVVASSAGVELTGQDCSADCGNIISTAYDAIISAGSNTRHSVKAIHVSGSSDAITLEGTASRLVVDAETVHGNDCGINFEGTGTVVLRCESLTVGEDFVLASAVGVAEIHAGYISKTSGTLAVATSNATVRVYGATIANAITCSAGTLELIDCICIGLVTQSSTGVIRYNAGTQFRSGTAGTVAAIGLAANTITASALATDAVNELADQITVSVAGRATGNPTDTTQLTALLGDLSSVSIVVYEQDGVSPLSLSGKTLALHFETEDETHVATIVNANIAVSGASNNTITFAWPAAVTASVRTLYFTLRDASSPFKVYLNGTVKVSRAVLAAS